MLPERIRNIRLKASHTQESLAVVIETSIRDVSRWENGESIPSADMLVRLADALNTSTDYLLGRTDDPTPVDVRRDGLSPTEREVIASIRQGNALEAIRTIANTGS